MSEIPAASSRAANDSFGKLTKSISFDWRLASYEIAATRAHILSLKAAGFLTEPEVARLDKALIELGKRVTNGMFQAKSTDEDVHSALERGLTEMVGVELGSKVLAGRFRNDQHALLIRLYLLDQEKAIRDLLLDYVDVLTSLAHDHLSEPMPGRTHFQQAQPVLISQHLLAHVWPIVRDLDRLKEWRARASFSSYGAGELGGTSLALDPNIVSESLGLAAPMANTMDAISSRDVAAEFAFVGTLIGINLSRFAEEIVIWSSAEFNYVTLSDSFATKSSSFSQANNPDVAELTRGKAGRMIGDLTGLLATLKGLPLSYNRDLQEDKEAIFDIADTLQQILPAFTGMISTMTFNVERMDELAGQGFTLATDVAEWLVKSRVPFREATEITEKLVTFASKRGVGLEELTDAELVSISPLLTPDVREALSVAGSIKARTGAGGTSVARVLDQISALRRLVPQGSR